MLLLMPAGTSLNSALLKGLQCTNQQSKLDPILVVLTDGQATDATSSAILANVKAANILNINIYSLAFGRSADFNFLHSLAHGNGGKADRVHTKCLGTILYLFGCVFEHI